MGAVRWISGLLLLVVSATAVAATKIDPDTLARLAGETSQLVPEIQRARSLAAAHGATLATYGGTSRELLDFVLQKSEELGGVDAYRTWLNSKPKVSLLDWHRLSSDLDFMLVPADANSNLNELKRQIERDFPSTTFYKKFDINISGEFFRNFPPGKEHFEAISNIALSGEGAVVIPELEVHVGSSSLNLTQWGLEQYAGRKLEFRINEKLLAAAKNDPFGGFRQALRWIRYASENPGIQLSEESGKAIRGLMDELKRTNRAELIRLLQERDSKGLGSKIIEALEKLQIYSKDSVRTEKLLQEFGIVELAREAGVNKARIFEALAERTGPANGRRLGKEIKLYHRSSLSASQNISKGALWKSNGAAVIGGHVTRAKLGPGVYAAELGGAPGYGEIFVGITLSPDAIEEVDFKKSGDYYVILTRDAIARDERGRLKIDPIDHEHFVENLDQRLIQIAKEKELPEDAHSVVRAIGSTIDPFSSPDELQRFESVRANVGKLGGEVEESFFYSFFKRRDVVRGLLGSKLKFADDLVEQLVHRLEGSFPSVPEANLIQEALLLPASSARFTELEKHVISALDKSPGLIRGEHVFDVDSGSLSVLREKYPSIFGKVLIGGLNGSGPFNYRFDPKSDLDRQIIRNILDKRIESLKDFYWFKLNPGFWDQEVVREEARKVVLRKLKHGENIDVLKEIEQLFFDDDEITSFVRRELEPHGYAALFQTLSGKGPRHDEYLRRMSSYVQTHLNDFLASELSLDKIERAMVAIQDEQSLRRLIGESLGVAQNPQEIYRLLRKLEHHPKRLFIAKEFVERIPQFMKLRPNKDEAQNFVYVVEDLLEQEPESLKAIEPIFARLRRGHCVTGEVLRETLSSILPQ